MRKINWNAFWRGWDDGMTFCAKIGGIGFLIYFAVQTGRYFQ